MPPSQLLECLVLRTLKPSEMSDQKPEMASGATMPTSIHITTAATWGATSDSAQVPTSATELATRIAGSTRRGPLDDHRKVSQITISLSGTPTCWAVAPDGKALAVAVDARLIRFFDLVPTKPVPPPQPLLEPDRLRSISLTSSTISLL
jgi:hypothetical protein